MHSLFWSAASDLQPNIHKQNWVIRRSFTWKLQCLINTVFPNCTESHTLFAFPLSSSFNLYLHSLVNFTQSTLCKYPCAEQNAPAEFCLVLPKHKNTMHNISNLQTNRTITWCYFTCLRFRLVHIWNSTRSLFASIITV